MTGRFAVRASDIASWLGVAPQDLAPLAGAGPARSGDDVGAVLLDPREVQAWLHHQPPGRDADGRPLAWLGERLGAVSVPQTVEGACAKTVQLLAGALGPTTLAILSVDGQRAELVASPERVAEDLQEVVRGVARWVALSGEPLLLTDPVQALHVPPLRDRRAAHHVLAVPIMPDGEPAYVLVLLRDATSAPFGDHVFTLVATAVAAVGLAIRRETAERELVARLHEATSAQRQLEAYAHDIRQTFAAEKQRTSELAEALSELEETYRATVQGLAIAVEAKDALTAGHITRVTRYGLKILDLVLPGEAANPEYEYGFLLHDIGKLSVPDAILGKEGPLTDEEWAVMRLHPESGRRILDGIPFLRRATDMVYMHHERWDGKGYPRRLVGEEVPVAARLFPVVDSYDAMTSDRPYRRAMSHDVAAAQLRGGAGSQFWREAVDAFLSVPSHELDAIRNGPTEWQPSRA